MTKSIAMNRRQFVLTSALASAGLFRLPGAFADERPAAPARLTLRADRLGGTIGEEFTGLSYESAQLGDPEFFTGDNSELVGFLKRLGKSGVLRIGGNTSEYCYWTPALVADSTEKNGGSAGKGGTDQAGLGLAVGPDTGHKAPPPVRIGPRAIRNLRDFLDASGWKLIYGLNMGTGTAEDAAAEAAYVMDVAGGKLLAFQLCNEPDLFFRNGIRKPDYDFGRFADDWERFFRAVRTRVPNAPFAGPDTASNDEWLVPFAKRFKSDVRFLTHHYYAEGPPTDPSMTIQRLLRPNPALQKAFESVKEAQSASGLPFRLAETNSCYQGGKEGVSDTLGSALWGADLMYQLALEGGAGINYHGGGYGWYTPISGTRANGFLARPIYYGMLLFAAAGSGRLVESKLDGIEDAPLLTAYGVRADDGSIKIAIFNKNIDRRVRLAVETGEPVKAANLLRLFAPRVDDATDVTFGGAPVGASGEWSEAFQENLSVENGKTNVEMPAASAALIRFSMK
ncbi:MAG TPA: glycosyl hydrolase family 79 C-terminal domain-containing protein [Verrucomicrobiae bacterium]|nr:glycosyl hydrolase family 79 C-terminal domain-containing protein [Verrucomicrobiae bacterium]